MVDLFDCSRYFRTNSGGVVTLEMVMSHTGLHVDLANRGRCEQQTTIVRKEENCLTDPESQSLQGPPGKSL